MQGVATLIRQYERPMGRLRDVVSRARRQVLWQTELLDRGHHEQTVSASTYDQHLPHVCAPFPALHEVARTSAS